MEKVFDRKTSVSGRLYTKEELKAKNYSNYMFKCKCSHTQLIPYNIDKVICSYCGKWIYKSKEDEFKDKIKNLLKERG